MHLSEDLVVLERFYSLSDTVNPILQDIILNSDDKSWIESSQGKYFLTNFAPFAPQDDELGSLVKWVQQIIYSDIVNIPLKCPEVWGVIYNKGINQIDIPIKIEYINFILFGFVTIL